MLSNPHSPKPARLEEAEVVTPEMLAKWRKWGVPEDIMLRAMRQRQRTRQIRQAEERVILPNFGYKMPRLPKIEANLWGFAKLIDTEGHIDVYHRVARDRMRRIDRWLYKYEYHRPRVMFATYTYELTEEVANRMHTAVMPLQRYDIRTKRHVIVYECACHSSRAVMVCHLIYPYLAVPEKQRSAEQILTIYKQHPMARIA